MTTNVWVRRLSGSGRYYSKSDKMGHIHPVFCRYERFRAQCRMQNQSSGITNCMDSDLVDVSNATVCVVGVGDCGLARYQSGCPCDRRNHLLRDR